MKIPAKSPFLMEFLSDCDSETSFSDHEGA